MESNVLKFGFNLVDPIRINLEFDMDEPIDLLKIISESCDGECKNIIKKKIHMISSTTSLNDFICLDNYYNNKIIKLMIEGSYKWFIALSKFITIDFKERKIKIKFKDNDIQLCAEYNILYFGIDKIET